MLQRRTTQANELVISYLVLRKLVGWIGMLLPFVLMIGNAAMSAARPDSMSGYYYTPMRDVFVGALCALGVFLVAYDGYDNVDRWITNIAGLCAIGVAFCPTKPSGRLSTWQNVAGDAHVVLAICTFTALGLMALRFARDDKAFLAVSASAAPFATVSVTRPASARLVYGSPSRIGGLFSADSGQPLVAAARSEVRLPVRGPRFTGFTGGVVVTGPSCVTFEVSSPSGRAATVAVPIGAVTCPS